MRDGEFDSGRDLASRSHTLTRVLNHLLAANAFTGLAMYDPFTNRSTATITAFDLTGNQVGSAMATVPALGKNVVNLNKLITICQTLLRGKSR